jgi:hypothetical protein
MVQMNFVANANPDPMLGRVGKARCLRPHIVLTCRQQQKAEITVFLL